MAPVTAVFKPIWWSVLLKNVFNAFYGRELLATDPLDHH